MKGQVLDLKQEVKKWQDTSQDKKINGLAQSSGEGTSNVSGVKTRGLRDRSQLQTRR
jgi:hypothetical protein